jgi:4-hydroxy-2-oxoheptanedioate aldolase
MSIPPTMPAIQKLRDGQAAFGTMIRLIRSPAIAAMARHSGFDLIMLDMEHGPYSFETLSDTVQAGKSVNLAVMVRVPELARSYVSRALDCGVDGVMVPMIETAEQAKNLADWAKFPPFGKRGLGSAGGHTMYAKPTDTAAFVAAADRQTITIAQVETITGANNADAIAAVPGIDALVVGPNDLAMSLHKPGQLSGPQQDQAIQKIADAAKKHGKIFGMHAGTAFLKRWVGQNMNLVINSMDMDILANGLAQLNTDSRTLKS